MRRKRVLGATIVALLVVGTPAVATAVSARSGAVSANTPNQGEWRGRSEQGTRLIFDVLNTRRGLRMQPVFLEGIATCQGSGIQIDVVFGGGSKPIAKNGSFGFRFFDPFFGSFDMQGKLGPTTGTGTMRFDLPSLTRNLGLQLCTSGDISWRASAPPSAMAPAVTPRVSVAYHVHLTVSRTGQISWTVTKG